jgi:hypothetical protein
MCQSKQAERLEEHRRCLQSVLFYLSDVLNLQNGFMIRIGASVVNHTDYIASHENSDRLRG